MKNIVKTYESPAMRVVVLGLRGFPGLQGGIETHSQNLYPKLVEKGVNVTVIVRKPYWRQYGKFEWQGVSFKPIWAPKTKGLEAFMHSLLGAFWAGFNRPDILHVHGVGPSLVVPIAKAFGLKVVMTHHGPDYERQKWGFVARNLLKLGEVVGVYFSDRVIVISSVIMNSLKGNKQKLVLIPNGVAINGRISSFKSLENLNIAGRKYIIFIGRSVPEKRHLDLIQAFKLAKLAGWKLLLVGGSDNPDSYEAEVATAAATDPDIILAGVRTGQDLAELYSHARLMVLPSSHEGHPIVVLEAMSYGLPVLLSDIPANLEIGLPKECYFFMGDTNSLSEKIKYWCNREWSDDDRFSYISLVAEKYNWVAIADRTFEVYSEIMKISNKV